jgi:hypothetical protein
LAKTGGIFSIADYGPVIAATDGFTGADLKRVVEDAKGLLAFDRANGGVISDSGEYLLRAVEAVALNKRRYAEAEAGARAKSKQIDPASQFFSQLQMGGGFVMNPDWTGSE